MNGDRDAAGIAWLSDFDTENWSELCHSMQVLKTILTPLQALYDEGSLQRWRCFLPLHKGEPLPLNWSAPTLGKAKGPSRD